jgi:Domain of unknown function (DUF4347)
MYSVLLHDERLSGNTPDWPETKCFTVEQDDATERILGWVSVVHRAVGKLEDLSIMCHGYVSATNGMGGHGLKLGKDGVYQSNISKWSAINGMVNWVIVYACNVAEVDPAVQPSQGNGQQLCSQMAAMTGATVIAPLKTQFYRTTWKGRHLREIDFGDFEGPLYMFRPDGAVTNLSKPPGAA